MGGMSLCTPAAALETPMGLQGSFYMLGGLNRASGEHLGQQELPCKPHIPRPASHLRLTDEAQHIITALRRLLKVTLGLQIN